MIDITPIIELDKVNLAAVNIAELNNTFDVINTNFEKLAQSPIFEGPSGFTPHISDFDTTLNNDNLNSGYLLNGLHPDITLDTTISTKDWYTLDGTDIANGGTIDPHNKQFMVAARFLKIWANGATTNNVGQFGKDLSGWVYQIDKADPLIDGSTDKYEFVDAYPKIGLDSDGNNTWFINGESTGVLVSGVAGEAGKATNVFVADGGQANVNIGYDPNAVGFVMHLGNIDKQAGDILFCPALKSGSTSEFDLCMWTFDGTIWKNVLNISKFLRDIQESLTGDGVESKYFWVKTHNLVNSTAVGGELYNQMKDYFIRYDVLSTPNSSSVPVGVNLSYEFRTRNAMGSETTGYSDLGQLSFGLVDKHLEGLAVLAKSNDATMGAGLDLQPGTCINHAVVNNEIGFKPLRYRINPEIDKITGNASVDDILKSTKESIYNIDQYKIKYEDPSKTLYISEVTSNPTLSVAAPAPGTLTEKTHGFVRWKTFTGNNGVIVSTSQFKPKRGTI